MPSPSKPKLKAIVDATTSSKEGNVANYIPELAFLPSDLTAVTLRAIGKKSISYSNLDYAPVTLQSTSKLIPLIALLEDYGPEKVFSWVRVEPSGDDFASIARLDQFGPKPSNPMLNAGAIALCSHIPGKAEKRFSWLADWTTKLFDKRLSINHLVLASEKNSGDRNRSLAYLLKSNGTISSSVKETLDLYFTLCSYEATCDELIELPYILANNGINSDQKRIISEETVKYTIAIMATCGLYNESGTHMVRTGIPAKSGVSGYMFAVVPGKAGIVILSPRVNSKGNSIRGKLILEALSKQYKWHFAVP